MESWNVPTNISEHPKVQWYRSLAAEHGECAKMLIDACRDINDNGIEAAVADVREAAHYALLVLGYEERAGQHLVLIPMDVRVADDAVKETTHD